MTNSEWLRDNSVMMSSAIPSEKYSCSGSPLILVKASTAIDGLPGNGNDVTRHHALETAPTDCGSPEPHHKSLNRVCNVLEIERPKLLKG